MEATSAIDKKINSYLVQLTEKQKKAVLTVVKTFAEETEASGYSAAFKKELDSRYDEYKNGGALISEAEVEKRIKRIINSKAAK